MFWTISGEHEENKRETPEKYTLDGLQSMSCAAKNFRIEQPMRANKT
jgi:hypothetical protein